MTDIITQLRLLSTAPEDEKAFNAWLEHQDAFRFLKENAKQDDCSMCSFTRWAFRMSRVDPPDVDDLLSWNFNAHDDSWGASYSFNPPEVTIEPPLSHTSSKTLDGGTKFVFPRSFDGLFGGETLLRGSPRVRARSRASFRAGAKGLLPPSTSAVMSKT
jgi:hypothetical protein